MVASSGILLAAVSACTGHAQQDVIMAVGSFAEVWVVASASHVCPSARVLATFIATRSVNTCLDLATSRFVRSARTCAAVHVDFPHVYRIRP